MANILILRNAASGDAHTKSGVAEVELQNGYAVALKAVSTERKSRNAYKLEAPTAVTDKIGIVYNADVPNLLDNRGGVYKGISHDPRDIVFPAGTVVDIQMPSEYDEIAMTEIAGTEEGAKYVVYKSGSMKPEYATTTDGAVLAYEITGKKFVSVGAERVPTVELSYQKL